MLAERLNPLLRRVPPAAVYAAGAMPFLYLAAQVALGQTGPDPVKLLERSLGLYALKFFIATLLVSPLRWGTGISLLKFRRALGVLSFVYAALHLLVWITLDLQFRWGQIGADITRQPYLVIGLAAFLLMLPLAVTSNNLSVRRMGAAAWTRLHLLAYPAVLLGAIHFLWQAKTWQPRPMTYFGIIVVLLGIRAVRNLSRRMARRQENATG